jgi:zinc protease
MAASTRIAVALLVTLLTLVASACSTKRTALVAPPTSVPIRHVLFNGVRVIIEEHRTSDVVAVQLWVKAGGRDEAASELGLAHYLEHMLFKGTPTRPGRLIDREVEGTGGRMNAGTSLDFTYYHMVLPASRAVAGVEILADIGVNASLDEPLLEAEKRVVLEEIRLGEDSPMRFLFKKTYESVFDGHPYGRPVIGTPELIRALTREQLVRFYRRLYSPENFTLVVVGAVNPDQIRDVATRAFSRLPRGGTARLPAPPIADLKPRAVALPRPGTQAYLTMAWMAPKLDHADTPALDLVVAILGQRRASRLTEALRERLGLVNSISAGYTAMEAAGVLTVTAQLETDNLARAEREILVEIQRVRDGGVTEAERERSVTAAEAGREFQMETAEGRAYTLGRAETVWRLEDELLYLDRLRSVTIEQMHAAARRYFDPERYIKVTLVPSRTR